MNTFTLLYYSCQSPFSSSTKSETTRREYLALARQRDFDIDHDFLTPARLLDCFHLPVGHLATATSFANVRSAASHARYPQGRALAFAICSPALHVARLVGVVDGHIFRFRQVTRVRRRERERRDDENCDRSEWKHLGEGAERLARAGGRERNVYLRLAPSPVEWSPGKRRSAFSSCRDNALAPCVSGL